MQNRITTAVVLFSLVIRFSGSASVRDSVHFPRFRIISANSVIISGTRIFCGQMDIQFPQPMQRAGSMGSPFSAGLYQAIWSPFFTPLYAAMIFGISSPTGHPSVQYLQAVHGTQDSIDSATSVRSAFSAPVTGLCSLKVSTFSMI